MPGEDILYYIIIPIASMIIGAIVVYHSSRKIFELEKNREKVNIARAFLSEIKAHENYLKPTINSDYLETHENPNSLNLQIYTTNHLHWHYPFYDNFDLFSTSRMAVFVLDDIICEKLHIFYDSLILSDDWRKEFNALFDKPQDLTNEKASQVFLDTINAVKHTFEPIEEIKKGLEEIIQMNEKPNFKLLNLKGFLLPYGADSFFSWIFASLYIIMILVGLYILSNAAIFTSIPQMFSFLIATGFFTITLGLSMLTITLKAHSSIGKNREAESNMNLIISKLDKIEKNLKDLQSLK